MMTRLSSIKTGTVAAFIPDPDPKGGSSISEGVAVDHEGNVYGAEVGPRDLKKYVKSATAGLQDQVPRTERAFAKTMAERDPAPFVKFLAGDSIFMSGGTASTGVNQITTGWKPLFEGWGQPFSW